MKKLFFGLILMLFAFCTLPVQANAPDYGDKKEIIKANAFDFVTVLEFSIETPQVLFENHIIYRPVELWNYTFQKKPTDLKILYFKKVSLKRWRLSDKHKVDLLASTLNYKNLHIDPGSFFNTFSI